MKTIVNYAQKVKEQHALNKTLAPVETDLTSASKAYAVGQKFIHDGVLYQAKTAIAQGAALVLNTNYEAADDVSSEIQTLTNNLSDEVETRAKLGSHNIFPLTIDALKALNTSGTWSGNSYTLYGITYACEVTNGYVSKITVSGTATATSTLELFGKNGAFVSNKYKGNILSGSPSGGSGTSYCIVEQTSASSAGTSPDFSRDDGSGTVIGNNNYARLYIRIEGGYAISGSLIFKPMIRLVSDLSTAYIPYAMTNRELTDFANIANNLVSNGGLRDIADNAPISDLTNGVYRLPSTRSSGLWQGYGVLVLVFKSTSNTGIQIAFKISASADISTQHIAVRISYLGTWSNWTLISGTNQT